MQWTKLTAHWLQSVATSVCSVQT